MDRKIDIDVKQKEFSTDRLVDPRGITALTQTGEVYLRQVRKRVPAGGPFKRFTQKPFINYRSEVGPYRGSINFDAGSGHTWMKTGSISGAFSSEGQMWSLTLHQFPPIGGARFNTNLPPGVDPDLLSQAEVKCLNKLRERSGEADMNYGLWYGERRETAELFRDAAYGLLNLARALAQKDYARSAKVLRDAFGVKTSAKAEARRLARVEKWLRYEAKRTGKTVNRTLKRTEDAVLQYNLGVSPLLKDLETVHQRLQTGDLTVKCAVLAKAQHSRVDQDVYRQSKGEFLQQVTLSRTHGYTVTLVAVPRNDDLAKLSRVGLTNPANTAWQLLGGSFIVDYFLPIGPYLQSLDVPLSFTFQAGSYTHRVTQIISGSIKSRGGAKAKGQSVLDYTQRKLYGAFPLPIPPLSLRQDSLSFRQALNTGLLAAKKLRKVLGI